MDTHGRLLGINSAIFSRSGGNQGIGFAVPSNLAGAVMKSLRENGRVIRGHIGIGVQTLTPELAEALIFQQTAGALVGQVALNSPAEKAGIKSGDVITGINGKKIIDYGNCGWLSAPFRRARVSSWISLGKTSPRV